VCSGDGGDESDGWRFRYSGPCLASLLDTLKYPKSRRLRDMPVRFIVSQTFPQPRVVQGHVAQGVITPGTTLFVRTTATNERGMLSSMAAMVVSMRRVGASCPKEPISREGLLREAGPGDLLTLRLDATCCRRAAKAGHVSWRRVFQNWLCTRAHGAVLCQAPVLKAVKRFTAKV